MSTDLDSTRLALIENLARLAAEQPDFSYGMARRRLIREVTANEWWQIAAELRAWRSRDLSLIASPTAPGAKDERTK